MIIHPPMLYLGFVSFTIPFAFAIAALLTRSLDTGWITPSGGGPWCRWFFLSIGITLGMWWAYVELGWGGYWAWDPVENASLLPWLTGTAFLHSVMIQEKRGMLKRWNVRLIVGTFLLSIFGTFITRSRRDRERALLRPVARRLLLPRLPGGRRRCSRSRCCTPAGRCWRPRSGSESVVSREAAFLFNNLLLVGIAFSVLWGTLFPILSELVRGRRSRSARPFFNRVNVPLGLLLLALTGVGPLIAWRKASTANLKRQFIGPVAAGW